MRAQARVPVVGRIQRRAVPRVWRVQQGGPVSVASPYAVGDYVYGTASGRVVATKWWRSSGWWYLVRDDDGTERVIPEGQIVSRS